VQQIFVGKKKCPSPKQQASKQSIPGVILFLLAFFTLYSWPPGFLSPAAMAAICQMRYVPVRLPVGVVSLSSFLHLNQVIHPAGIYNTKRSSADKEVDLPNFVAFVAMEAVVD